MGIFDEDMEVFIAVRDACGYYIGEDIGEGGFCDPGYCTHPDNDHMNCYEENCPVLRDRKLEAEKIDRYRK